MFKKLKALILNPAYDRILGNIQSVALVIMMICVLTFFMVKQFVPNLLRLHITIFSIATAVTLLIGILWFLKDFIPYRDSALKQFYEENPEYAPKSKVRKEDNKSNEKKDNRSKD